MSLSDAVSEQDKQEGLPYTTVAIPNCRRTQQNDADESPAATNSRADERSYLRIPCISRLNHNHNYATSMFI